MMKPFRAVLLCIWLFSLSSIAASDPDQTVRELMEQEPDFQIFTVIFGITVTSASARPEVRLARVTDPRSGTTDAVPIEIPMEFIKAVEARFESSRSEPEMKNGEPVEFFTYFLYVPGHADVVVVDIDMPLNAQP